MINLWRCVESASPVQIGAPNKVIKGGMPVNKPICAPLNPND